MRAKLRHDARSWPRCATPATGPRATFAASRTSHSLSPSTCRRSNATSAALPASLASSTCERPSQACHHHHQLHSITHVGKRQRALPFGGVGRLGGGGSRVCAERPSAARRPTASVGEHNVFQCGCAAAPSRRAGPRPPAQSHPHVDRRGISVQEIRLLRHSAGHGVGQALRDRYTHIVEPVLAMHEPMQGEGLT